MTVHLRLYQKQALAAEAKYRREHPEETRLAIVMATGLGKTIVMAERARRHVAERIGYYSPTPTGGRVLILVHTDELAQQAETKVRLVVGRDWSVGVVKAERDEVIADIIIGSVQTLANPERRARIQNIGLVIVDECHHVTASTYQDILRWAGCLPTPLPHPMDSFPTFVNKGPLTPALGFTATLERGDGTSLGGTWQNVVFTRDIGWGVRHGYLVQPIGHRITVPIDGNGERFAQSAALQDMQLADSIAPERVVDKWLELAKDRQTVLFAPLVRSARMFALAFNDADIRADAVYGDMPAWQRREVLSRYEAGEIQVLCNAMVLTEGWDSPSTTCVIVARPTQSRPLFVQMAGRGLRPDPLKPADQQNCILLVVADATTDMCTVADLSDRPIDRKAEGALTALEDEWDIGKGIEDAERHWTGRVDVSQFEPLVARRSKVWRTTKGGTPFLPISDEREYVFVVGTSVYLVQRLVLSSRQVKVTLVQADLPDLEMALTVAEDEAAERGGDIGALLADHTRAWRRQKPSDKMLAYADRMGLSGEVERIMAGKTGGKAGKVSDLITRVQATRALDPIAKHIKEEMGK